MRQSLKIALSLLIAVVVFSGFTLLAYSGLFTFIETNFYNPRIKADFQRSVDQVHERIVLYHQNNYTRYASRLEPEYVARSFLTNQLQEDIAARARAFGEMLKQYPDLQFVRFVGPEGREIHFSTLPSDLKEQSPNSRVYLTFDQVAEAEPDGIALSEGEEMRLSMDPTEDRFIYSLPIQNQFGTFQGTALFYVSYRDLYNYLFRVSETVFSEVAPIGALGFVVGFPEEQIQLIGQEVEQKWSAAAEGSALSYPISATTGGERYFLFTRIDTAFGTVGQLAPASEFEIQATMRIILLAAFFLTTYLIVFLLFNIRQDPVTSARARIKHFQIDFLQQFVKSKDQVDWAQWRRELATKEPALKRQIRKGLGTVPAKNAQEIDTLIDKSWDEILLALGGRAEAQGKETTDLSRIEDLLNRVIERGLVGTSPAAVPTPTVAPAIGGAEAVEALEEVEEVEEVEEIPEAEVLEALEAVEAVDAVEEVEEIPGAAEAVEALEEVELVEAVAEVNAVEEVEEIPEAEVLEALEEVEPVAEVETVEEAEDAEGLESVAGTVEDIGHLQKSEDFREFGGIEIDESITALGLGDGGEQFPHIGQFPEVDEDDEPAEIEEEEDDLEELEMVTPISVLPALPFETLDYLLEVTEAQIVKQDDRGNGRTARVGAATVESVEMRALLDERQVSVLSIVELLDIVESSSESIVLEDGVYKIREEIYDKAAEGKVGDLQSLASSVLGGSQQKSRVSHRRVITIGRRGVDYDQFLSQFPRPITDRVVLRSLVAISQDISAVSVVLLVARGTTYKPILNVGVDDETLSRFVFRSDETIFRDVFRHRNAILLNLPFETIVFLRDKISSEDVGYVKRAAFLPAVYEKDDAYLFFGFAKERKLTAREILAGLKATRSPERSTR